MKAAGYTLGTHGLDQVADLVCAQRPDWDRSLVRIVLASHRDTVSGNDLAIAALRAAGDPTMLTPKTIGWRGPHWQGLTTRPVEQRREERCDVCGLPESRCWTERPGPDDHVFSPRASDR